MAEPTIKLIVCPCLVGLPPKTNYQTVASSTGGISHVILVRQPQSLMTEDRDKYVRLDTSIDQNGAPGNRARTFDRALICLRP